MTKLRHGLRFGTPIVSTKPFVFDETRDERRDRMKMNAILKNQPRHKKELRYWKTKQGLKQRYAYRGEIRAEREAAELQMAEAIRTAVQILEHNMTALMQHVAPGMNYDSHVNQASTINAIVALKTKCGVHFDAGGDFMEKVEIDPASKAPSERTPEQVQIDDDFRAMTTEVQRRERLKREERMKRILMMKEAAKRIEDKKKQKELTAKLFELSRQHQEKKQREK